MEIAGLILSYSSAGELGRLISTSQNEIDKKFDLIVIGTKGITGVEKFLTGGVASAVVHNAHCPVFAIR